MEGAYLLRRVERACRQNEIAVAKVADQFLLAAPTIHIEQCVFILSRLANTSMRGKFWHKAATLIEARVPEMSGDVLGLAANAFHRVDVRVDPLMDAIAHQAVRNLGSLPTRSLTLALHSSTPSGTDAFVACGTLASRLPEMNDQDASLFLSGLKTAPGKRSGIEGTKMLDSLKKQSEHPEVLTPTAIAQLVQAFARLAVRDKALRRLEPTIIARVSEFLPQSLGMIANAYARLGQLSRELLSAIDGVASADLRADQQMLSRASPKRTSRYDHVAVSQLMNAHAKMSIFDVMFFKATMDWMTPTRLATFNPQSLSNALHSFAKFTQLYQHKKDMAELRAVFSSCVPHVLSLAPACTTQNLVNILMAFSRLRFWEPAVFDRATEVLLLSRSKWKSQDAAVLASSLARVEFFNDSICAGLVEASLRLMADFRGDELSTLLNALAHFTRIPQTGEDGQEQPPSSQRVLSVLPVFEAAATRLTGGGLRTNMFELALMVNACAKVRLSHPTFFEHALDEVGSRLEKEELTVAVLGLVLSGLARLQRLPPQRLTTAALSLVQKRGSDGGRVWHDLDVVRTVGIFHAVVKLDTLSCAESSMWPWLKLLLRRLSSSLDQGAQESDLNMHTLPTAFNSLGMLGCRKVTAEVSELLWQCSEQIAASVVTRQRRLQRCAPVVGRQILQAVLLFHQLNLRDQDRQRLLSLRFLQFNITVLNSFDQVQHRHSTTRTGEQHGEHKDLEDVVEVLRCFRTPTLGGHILSVYGIDVVLFPTQCRGESDQ